MALVSALAVGIGGSAGALARYAVAEQLERGAVGTLLVNVLGSLLLGVVLGAGAGDLALLAVGVGFCGAFTTFSTFAVETVRLAEDGDVPVATVNALGTLVLALLAVLAGIELGGVLG